MSCIRTVNKKVMFELCKRGDIHIVRLERRDVELTWEERIHGKRVEVTAVLCESPTLDQAYIDLKKYSNWLDEFCVNNRQGAE